MSGRREAAYALAAYGAYLGVRAVVWNDRGRQRALENAARVVDMEQHLGIAVEGRVQELAMRWPRLVDVLNAGYAAGNVSFSVGWLLKLHGRRDPDFRAERIAAMPSHHVAFAVVTGFGLSRRSRTPWGRLLSRTYPALVATTVVATGNHFTADVAAGAALGVVARGVARRAVSKVVQDVVR